MNLLVTASGDAEAMAAAQAGSPFILIAYILMIYRPQKKEQKRKSAMMSSIEVGDSVLTTSGFYGIVIDITDEDVIVEFGNNKNCRIPMKKAAIEQVEKPEGYEKQ